MKIDIDTVSHEELLHTRLCDLGLTIRGTVIEDYINQLYDELKQKGMQFLPPCYISDEWFSPHGVGAIAIPFYLMHPRLLALEKKMMRTVEGETKPEALKLLRHESGHAYVHAFNLTRKSRWREMFGHPGKTYTEHYRYRPYSKSFVNNLRDFYAQSHPEEDFAETFAVWLDPQSNWKQHYENWPALRKLNYVEELMESLKGTAITVNKKDFYYPISKIKKRLALHYDRMIKLYGEDIEDFFDEDLSRLFPASEGKGSPAADLIIKNRRRIEESICRHTKEKKYIVSRLVTKLIRRMKVLKLNASGEPRELIVDFAVYVTSLTSNYRYTNQYKGGE
ncbi:MAG: putative zinc-binding metallopeptidase [Spirochaetes bacterium]|nr:putative zinc-binding metallopeptidase [Spirochaetota bacterium]